MLQSAAFGTHRRIRCESSHTKRTVDAKVSGGIAYTSSVTCGFCLQRTRSGQRQFFCLVVRTPTLLLRTLLPIQAGLSPTRSSKRCEDKDHEFHRSILGYKSTAGKKTPEEKDVVVDTTRPVVSFPPQRCPMLVGLAARTRRARQTQRRTRTRRLVCLVTTRPGDDADGARPRRGRQQR